MYYNQEAHIVRRCQWKTGFDSKSLAHELQTTLSTWSAYKMKRIIANVFDSICPKGQTLKIHKLEIDLGAITYENMLSELPLRLEEALRSALYDLIMYPKSGDRTLEIVNEHMAQISVLRTFLLQGMMPWNYQETYGSATQIMRSQLMNNRLDVIQMIQEIGLQENVRKRISWQFTDDTIKKIIAGLEPNNHQQIINFSEEFVKVQERETIVQTSTNDLKKNIWLWILNYLFTDRGTIFNKVAFVRNTVEQMANHFNVSYDAMLELIENAVERTREYSHINKGFIAILKLLSEELHHTSFTKVKTKKQKENFWVKVADYFNEPSKRSTPTQKNEFNELVINLSKLDAIRFQKIVLNVEQKPTTWKTILIDLIPASIENLFVALSPSQSKSVLTEISFLSKLNIAASVKVDKLDLYAFGIEFCIANQNTSVSKNAFLAFIVQKLAIQQQQTKLVILDHFVAANVTNAHKKTTFIPLFKTLNTLYQQEVSSSKIVASEETLHRIITTYISEIQNNKSHSKQAKELEKTILTWISTSPQKFWNVVAKVEKTHSVTVHMLTLISTYGTHRFLKQVQPETFNMVEKVQQFIDELISKNPKQATALRTLKHVLLNTAFEVVWKHEKLSLAKLFSEIVKVLKQSSAVSKVSTNAIEEAIQLLLNYPKTKTLAWSSQEFEMIQKQHKANVSKTVLEEILELIQQPNKELIVAAFVSQLVRSKKTATNEFKVQENTLISYILSNGIQIRERLVSRFLKQISATKITFTTTEIKTILQDCFWQSLVTYDLYRGNERKFIALFEETVFETFLILKTEKIEVKTANVDSKQSLEILYKTTDLEILEETDLQISTTEKIKKERTNVGNKKSLETLYKKPDSEVFEETDLQTSETEKIKKERANVANKKLLETSYKKPDSEILEETDLQTSETEKIKKEKANIANKKLLETSYKKPDSEILEETDLQTSETEKIKKEKANLTIKNQTLTTPYKIVVSVLFEALKENLKAANSSFEISKTTYAYKELFVVGLETSPTEIRTLIKETIQTEKQILLIQNSIHFEEFIVLIASDLSNAQQAVFKAIHMLFVLAKQLGNSQLMASLETIFWKQTIVLIQTKNTAKKVLEELVKTTFDKLSEITTLDQITVVKHIQNSGLKVPEILKIVLIERHQIFELVSEEIHENTLSEAIKTCIKQQKIELLSEYLITQFAIPAWFQHKEARDYRSIVNELMLHQPIIILKTIRSQQISEVQLTKFSQTVHFATLIQSLLKLYPTQQKQLADVQKLYEHIALVSMNGISTKVLQEILVKKVLTAWRTSNWSLIASTNIWNEFLWETCGKKGVKERDFFKAINTIKTTLPTSLLVTYKNVLPVVKPTLQTQKTIEYEHTKKPSINTKPTALPAEGVAVPNAGLVLLNSYFLMLLERLGTVADKAFKTPEDQLDAVHYLQYIVTGLTQTDESLLTLNKVLSGLSPDAPVRDSIEMTEGQKQLIDGLIQAAIGYWSNIGDTSVNGFRGNWLVRNGILRETDERWELTVEKRAYDVLLMKSPFSFSIIKLPWMRKPLHVTWIY